MNSANVFSYAMSGSYTENQINRYSEAVSQNVEAASRLGGWLGNQAANLFNDFKDFVSSRSWELGKRLLGENEGEYVGRFEIGYLGSVNGIQNATGLMRDYITAHRDVSQMALDELINPYNGEFSKLCTGVGEDNLFYRRAMDGVLNLTTEEVEGKRTPTLRHTHYYETSVDNLSFREIVNIHKTWRAIDSIGVSSLFDLVSTESDEEENPSE